MKRLNAVLLTPVPPSLPVTRFRLMKNRPRIIVSLFLALLLGVIGWQMLRLREPRYNGRSLSSWLQQLQQPDTDPELPDGSSSKDQARDAIRQIGTRGLPYLMAALTNVDSRLQTTAQSFCQRYLKLPLRSAADSWSTATSGFVVLGPAAKPALGGLVEALERPKEPWEVCDNVAMALAAIGPDGWKVLMQELPGTNLQVQTACVTALSSYKVKEPEVGEALLIAITNNPTRAVYFIGVLGQLGQRNEKVIPFLIAKVVSGPMSAPNVRKAAIDALGNFQEQSAVLVPVLAAQLTSTNPAVQVAAVEALRRFGTNALSAVPALFQLLRSSAGAGGRETVDSLQMERRVFMARYGVGYLAPTEANFILPPLILDVLKQIDLQAWQAACAAIKARPRQASLAQWLRLGTGAEQRLTGPTLAQWLSSRGTQEPEYQGRSLTQWLKDALPMVSPMQTYVTIDAARHASENALRAMSTNTIPWLLTWLNQDLPPEAQLLGRRGFLLLGNEAAIAIPALAELGQTNLVTIRDMAYRSLDGINADWETIWLALIPALHHPDEAVRVRAAEFLCDAYPEQAQREGVYRLLHYEPSPDEP